MTVRSGDLILLELPGKVAQVLMLPKIAKEFQRLPSKDRLRLEQIMSKYSEGADLHDTQFKFETRVKTGGKNVPVYAFKTGQKRVYGVPLTGAGGRKFVCSELDASKKQDRADQECLKRAAQNVAGLIEEGWAP